MKSRWSWRCIFIGLLMLLCVAAVLMGGQESSFETKWVGVRAPAFAFKDRNQGELIDLARYRSQRVLLFSFNSGGFAQPPDSAGLLRELEAAKAAITTNTQVIGFTRGVMFFGLGTVLGNLAELTDFPIVNLNNKYGDAALPAPYTILEEPGAILIDANGVIVAVHSGPMLVDHFRRMLQGAASWEGPVRLLPNRETVGTPESRTTVVAPRLDLSAGHVLQLKDLGYREVASDSVDEGAVFGADINRLPGLRLSRSSRRAEPLLWRDLLSSERRDYVEGERGK